MILWGQDGSAIWDSDADPMVAVFGTPGSGKTVLASHAIRSWLRSGGTAVVGAHFPGEYERLSRFVHLASPEEAVGYGRVADLAATPENQLLIVLDEMYSATPEDIDYLHTREDSNVRWFILDRDPFVSDRVRNIGMMHGMSLTAFQLAYKQRAMPRWDVYGASYGHTVREYVDGFVESAVPPSAMEGLFETEVVYKRPLPLFPRRSLYAAPSLCDEDGTAS